MNGAQLRAKMRGGEMMDAVGLPSLGNRYGVRGMVASASPAAATAGMRVLLDGGNAFDAAIAVGATLNMMEPQMNGIGGNGFMTIYDKKSGKVMSLAMARAGDSARRRASRSV